VIAGLFLAVLLQTAPAAAPADETDIIVIARRLSAVSAQVGKDVQGRFRCSLSASTGRADLDAKLCRAASDCVRKGARDQTAVASCLDRTKPKLLEALRRTLGQGGRS
jgi:hypothetical protein